MCMSKCYRLPFHDLTLRFVLAKLVLFHIQFNVSSIFFSSQFHFVRYKFLKCFFSESL